MRRVLSLFSIFFSLGTFGLFFFFVYCNFSMAQLEIPKGSPIEVNWALPGIDVVVEYNQYSIDEEDDSLVEPARAVAVKVEKEEEEESYRNPGIVEIQKIVVGDDVNSDELVEHYGFPSPDVESIKTIDLTSYVDNFHLEKLLAEFGEKKRVREDVVFTEKSSTKKDTHSSKEMIFIDYSKKKEEPPPPPKVVNLLADASSRKAPLKIQKIVEKKKSGKEEPLSPLLALAGHFVKKEFFKRSIRAYSAVDGRHLDFQFVPDYDSGEVFSSDGRGIVDVYPEKRLSEGLLRGRLVSPEHMRTVVNLPVSGREGADFDIPLVDEWTFEQYREREGNVGGGSLLVWISKKVEDVDISNDYSYRLFLDGEFREVSQEDGYSYILFMGIQPGVTTLSHLLEGGQIAEKPVYISVDEILYDFAPLEKARHDAFKLYQKNLFSGKRVELGLGEKEIHYFNRKLTPVKKGLNYYEMKIPPASKGERNYLKLEHLDGLLHIGYGSNKQLEIPEQDFIENIIDGFGIDDLSDSCLVQLNFSDPVIRFKGSLDSYQQSDDFELIYLNSDGTFEEMPSLKTEKAFILGKSQGVLSVGAEHLGGQWTFFKSFCSLGSYLIEQL